MVDRKEFSKQILECVNRARADPPAFASEIEKNELPCIDDEGVLSLPDKDPLQLDEGKEAYLDCIKQMKAMPAGKLEAFKWNDLLESAAKDHQADLEVTGDFSHKGSDQSTYRDRIERYCRWGGSIFEAMDFAARTDPKDIVVSWLVDDGNKKRSTRSNLLSTAHKNFAASFGAHLEAENCCVAVLAAQVVPKNADDGEELNARKIASLTPSTATIPPPLANKRQKRIKEMDWKVFSLDVFELQNKVRRNPQSFIPVLEKAITRFYGKVLKTEDGLAAVETDEGADAYYEAIEFLKEQEGILPLKWNMELTRAAQDHVNDVGPSGNMSSIGSDGSLPVDRMARYCMINETWAESSCFGSTTPTEVVEQMLVNDGQTHRGFRKAMFNPLLTIVGIASGYHSQAETMTQFEYAKGILREGQTQQINVTLTDDVPEELINKMQKMGIDTKKMSFGKKSNEKPKTRTFQVNSGCVQGAQDKLKSHLSGPQPSVKAPAPRKSVKIDQNQAKNLLPPTKTVARRASATNINQRKSPAGTVQQSVLQNRISPREQKQTQMIVTNPKPPVPRSTLSAGTKQSALKKATSPNQATKRASVRFAEKTEDNQNKETLIKEVATPDILKAAGNLRSQVVDRVITFSKLDSVDDSETLLANDNDAQVRTGDNAEENKENKLAKTTSAVGAPAPTDAGREQPVVKRRMSRADRAAAKAAATATEELLKKQAEEDEDFAKQEEAALMAAKSSAENGPKEEESKGGPDADMKKKRSLLKSKTLFLKSHKNANDDELSSANTFSAQSSSDHDEEEEKDEVAPVTTAGKKPKLDKNLFKSEGVALKKKKGFQRAKTMFNKELEFDVMSDPDYPADAVNSNIIVEHIEANGRMQKVYKKTYYLIDGKTINITRMEQM